MKLGVVKESNDQRVFIVPALLSKFKGLGIDILMENGASDSAGFAPSDYESVEWAPKEEVIKNADVLDAIQNKFGTTRGWKKVYEDGLNEFGEEVSYHYFLDTKTGQAWGGKIKQGWSAD